MGRQVRSTDDAGQSSGRLSGRTHSIKKLAGIRQRRFLKGSRHVGALVIVSALALIVERPLTSFRSFVKNGTSHQRAKIISRSPVSRLCRMMG